LVDWQAGDPIALLALPSHITALVEDRLSVDPNGTATRLRIARIAMDALDPQVWGSRLDDLLGELTGPRRAEAARYSAICRIRSGDRDSVEPLVDEGCTHAEAVDLLWLTARLIRLEEGDLARRVLARFDATEASSTETRVAAVLGAIVLHPIRDPRAPLMVVPILGGPLRPIS
jgi:hypothetical protein